MSTIRPPKLYPSISNKDKYVVRRQPCQGVSIMLAILVFENNVKRSNGLTARNKKLRIRKASNHKSSSGYGVPISAMVEDLAFTFIHHVSGGIFRIR